MRWDEDAGECCLGLSRLVSRCGSSLSRHFHISRQTRWILLHYDVYVALLFFFWRCTVQTLSSPAKVQDVLYVYMAHLPTLTHARLLAMAREDCCGLQ
jgi:hypothetical protein